MPDSISDLTQTAPAQTFLEVLGRNPSSWLTRKEIKNGALIRQLSTYHIECIEALVDKGLVEKSTKDRGRFGVIYIYRLKQKPAEEMK